MASSTPPTSAAALVPFSFENRSPVHQNIYETDIPDVFIIKHSVFPDNRGLYRELEIIPDLEHVTHQSFSIKQVNHARSFTKVARGFHAEMWNKLVTVTQGTCWSVIADIRTDSPTFGKTQLFIFGMEPDGIAASLYIPAGIANSLCVVDGPVDYLYCVDALYRERDTSGDQAISLFDPDLAVNWPFAPEELVISDRDKSAVTLREKFPHKF